MIVPALLILTALLAVVGGWVVVRGVIGDRAKGRVRCPKCWYDMQGAPGLVCSECGHDAGTPANLTRTRRSRRIVAVGLLMLALTWYPYEVSHRVQTDGEPIAIAILPTTYGVVAYPYVTIAERSWVSERVRRSRAERPIAWEWQARILARHAGNVFVANADNSQSRWTGLWDLERVTSRWNVAVPQVVQIVRAPSTSVPEREVAYKMLATVAGRNGDPDAVAAIVAGLQEPMDGLGAQNVIYLSGIPDAGWQTLSDDDVSRLARRVWTNGFTHADSLYLDRVLHLVTSRPKIAKPTLQAMLDRPPDRDPFLYTTPRMLSLLSALRRSQGRKQPLTIQLAAPTIEWRDLAPSVHVTLLCTEPERPELVWIKWTHHAFGRHEGWRVSVRDERGIELPVLEQPVFPGSGGLSQLSWLGFATQIDLTNRIARPPPGRYTMRVQFHDRIRIAGTKDVSQQHWLFESDPIPLIVTDE